MKINDYVEKINSLSKKNKKKIVVWMIGGFSSGKSTQSRNICNYLLNGNEIKIVKRKVKDKIFIKSSLFGIASNLGIVNDNACSGADTVRDKTSRHLSFLYCIKNSNIVFIDAALYTHTWWKMFQDNSDHLLLVHLSHKDIDTNIKFLMKRRKANKKRQVKPMNETTLGNLNSHLRRGKSHFQRADEFLRDEDRKIEISTELKKNKISKIILRNIYRILRGS